MDANNTMENDSYETWSARVKKELGDKDISTLDWINPTGLDFKAYYPISSSIRKFPYISSRIKNDWNEEYDWDIYEPIFVKDAKQANKQAVSALANGAKGLLFTWLNPNADDLPMLLEGIELPYIQLGFEIPRESWLPCATAIRKIIDQAEFPVTACYGFFQCDFTQYKNSEEWANALDHKNLDREELSQLLPVFRFGNLNMAFLGSAGLSSDWELALTLAAFADHLENNRIAPEQGIQINLSVGGDYYTELAKFRIAPYLFHLVAEKQNASIQPYVLASMNQTYLSHLDTYTNVLRLGTASMAAVIGGCSGLVLVPFRSGENDNLDFIARITRNVQLVLQHESGIAKNMDPAAGSSFLEEMSFRLSEQVWENFLHIQSKGGLIPYLISGELDDKLVEAKEKIQADIRNGKRAFLGVNRFINPKGIDMEPEQKAGVFAPLRASLSTKETKAGEVHHG